ncbi:hypothetical protein M422DRAFT_60486 [Sphaerobolus stellatus SS14]|uniref:EF-hand domain-containing protein n=1 Tax=Sphaerobolus stellatus (strain SS14) TaxID=990650 RepID=A0A0C9UE89_SPHS4|nr:hypothetical protein M422DRAFT_60486 [Sphaerobolus stellatus SS14]
MNKRPSLTLSQKCKILLACGKYTLIGILSSVLGLTLLITGIFLHDAFTYNDDLPDIPLSSFQLGGERGGPKNLPLAGHFFRDGEDEERRDLSKKERLVIVGGGWGAVSLLNTLSKGAYQVVLVAPETFTTFTPLLPSAAVGTVHIHSLIEPLRKVISRLRGYFVQGKAVDLVMNEKLLEVETPLPNGGKQSIYIPYDKLVIAVGSCSATHGVPGIEHCLQLKTISDAQAIRRRLLDNFEMASLPTTTREERDRLLSFVICGGGPTGIETAAEIYDLCQEDIVKYYPKLVRAKVSIHVIQSRSHILNTYAEDISKYAEEKFRRDRVHLITDARVSSVTPNQVVYTTREPHTGERIENEIATNFVLCTTGISMNPFTQRVSDLLPNQVHQKAIVVDPHLRVVGAPQGSVYAVGDCATIQTNIMGHILEYVDAADKNNDGKIDYEEWEDMVEHIKKTFPSAKEHVLKARELFEEYDYDRDSSLGLNDLAELLQSIGRKLTSLPATAQVASQQGKYLGLKLSKLAKESSILGLSPNDILPEVHEDAVAEPFEYKHLGSLAYIGNAAVFDMGKDWNFMGGLVAMYAWRSIYWSELVSSRSRALLMFDWIIRGIWGRDLSKL